MAVTSALTQHSSAAAEALDPSVRSTNTYTMDPVRVNIRAEVSLSGVDPGGAWGGRAHPILSVGGPCHITGPPNKMC
jgi:hypothetical protein